MKIKNTYKYKIIFFSKETRGGTGTFLKSISKIDINKFEKKFYFYNNNSDIKKKKNYEFLNVEYPSAENVSFLKLKFFFINLYRTYTILRMEKPKIIVACDPYSSIILSLIKKMVAPKSILVHIIGVNLFALIKSKPNLIYRETLTLLVKNLYRKGDLLIFVSKSLSKFMINRLKLDKTKTEIIYNGINLSEIKKFKNKKIEIKIEKTLLKKVDKIFIVGRLNDQKDTNCALKAFNILIKKDHSAELFIIGDGKQKKQLTKLSRDLNLEKQIHFLGWKRNIFPYLKYADLLIFSSFYEGFGLVIVEAMALGIPVIATDSPYGPTDILEDGKYGSLVSIGDYNQIANQAYKILTNNKRKKIMSQLSSQRAKMFDEKIMLKSYEKSLLNLIYEKRA